ncbi:MAG TPA: hypothetical protein PLA94_15095 [Myxococcota bacterium]|nr:hypothetical protein [Myxococcota bacterium]
MVTSALSTHVLVVEDEEGPNATAAQPSAEDEQMFREAVALLWRNRDIALWATCLVQGWSPELRGYDLLPCLSTLLSTIDGRVPWTVTYANVALPDATMWAFTYSDIRNNPAIGSVGVIIPINHSNWNEQKIAWRRGGTGAFCVLVNIASNILHELIHICDGTFPEDLAQAPRDNHFDGPSTDSSAVWDHPFTTHDSIWSDTNNDGEAQPEEFENYTLSCWDEPRMIASIFLWSMSTRYTCIREAGDGSVLDGSDTNTRCQHVSDATDFATSRTGG